MRCVLLFFFAAAFGRAALIPPFFVSSVVAVGHMDRNPDGSGKWTTEASGFFYGYLVKDDPEPTRRLYETFLVTNRHVIVGHTIVSIRLNPKKSSDEGKVFNTPAGDWFTHPDPTVDIAAARVNWGLLTDQEIDKDFMTSDTNAADTLKMTEMGVSAGDPIFVLGFPLGLAGEHRNYAIVRPGAIARINDLMASAVSSFLIDAHVFPGNSGGPVILGPNLVAIGGTKNNTTAYLVGVVRGFIPFVDVAVSQQTQRPREISEENSGLAEVIPIDRVNEAIKAWRSALPVGSPRPPLKTAPPSVQ